MSNKLEVPEEQDDQEPDQEPDEQDLKELEEARQRDLQTKEVDEVVESKSEPIEESEEIAALRAACQKFQDKISWHDAQIEEHREEIKGHEDQIEELKTTLRRKFGNLVGEISAKPTPNKVKERKVRVKQSSSSRASYGEGNSTAELITSYLKKTKKPINTAELVAYMTERGNTTNPSVELSRMVEKGQVRRPSRGHYEWCGGWEAIPVILSKPGSDESDSEKSGYEARFFRFYSYIFT